MNPISMIISFVLIITGLLLYLIANRLPRNLLFGFRIGYTLSSRKLWIKYNRLSGLALALIGLISLVLSIFIVNIIVYVYVILGMTIASYIILTYMASREAEKELSFRKVEEREEVKHVIKKIIPVKPSYLRILLAVLPPIISLITTYYLLPFLPGHIPVHYDINGVPDRWDTLDNFLKTTVPYMIGAQCITLIFIFIELKVPMIFYLPRLPKEKLVNLMYDIGIMMAWLLLLAYTDILYYAVNNKHLIPTTLVTILTIAIVTIIIIRITILWTKWKRIVKE